jgi:hypothetical protein
MAHKGRTEELPSPTYGHHNHRLLPSDCVIVVNLHGPPPRQQPGTELMAGPAAQQLCQSVWPSHNCSCAAGATPSRQQPGTELMAGPAAQQLCQAVWPSHSSTCCLWEDTGVLFAHLHINGIDARQFDVMPHDMRAASMSAP